MSKKLGFKLGIRPSGLKVDFVNQEEHFFEWRLPKIARKIDHATSTPLHTFISLDISIRYTDLTTLLILTKHVYLSDVCVVPTKLVLKGIGLHAQTNITISNSIVNTIEGGGGEEDLDQHTYTFYGHIVLKEV